MQATTTRGAGPFPLERLKEVLVFRAQAENFLQPLQSFFRRMDLEWGDTKTAHAEQRGDRAVIVLGREFFAREVQSEGEAVDILMHEIMHHLFAHLFFGEAFATQGFSEWVQNIAMDAIINAYLHTVGCASFMARYYEDEGHTAFLRYGSEEFRVKAGLLATRRLAEVNQTKYRTFTEFYRKLYELAVTLEEALAFFKENFPKPEGKKQMLGSHGPQSGKPGKPGQPGKAGKPDKPGQQTQSAAPAPAGKPQQPPMPQAGGEEPGGIFSPDDAAGILRRLGVFNNAQKTRNNFARIVQKVTSNVNRPGGARTGTRLSRRMPARLSRRDLIRTELAQPSHELFTRADYRQKEVWLFFDVSGSVAAYVPFVIDLIVSLRRSELKVRAVCWAITAEEVPFDQLKEGNYPEVGGGTNGECVALFIREHSVQQAIVITDNAAGSIITPIRGRVELVLMQGADTTGSFVDKTKVPNCTVHQLTLG